MITETELNECKIKAKKTILTNKFLTLCIETHKAYKNYNNLNRPTDEKICLALLDVLENLGMKIENCNNQTIITFPNKFKIPD